MSNTVYKEGTQSNAEAPNNELNEEYLHNKGSEHIKRQNSLNTIEPMVDLHDINKRNISNSVNLSSFYNSKDIFSDCAFESDCFRLYQSGKHEHTLPVLPIVESVRYSEERNKIDEKQYRDNKLNKSGIFNSLLHMYNNVTHSTDNDNNCIIHTKSLLAGVKLQDKLDINPMPAVINSESAVGLQELRLIDSFSKRMKTDMERLLSNRSIVNDSKDSKYFNFTDKYGIPIATVGEGSYGLIKVSVRNIKISDGKPYQTYTYDGKIFYAVKKLQPRGNDDIKRFSEKTISEFIIGYSLNQFCRREHKLYCKNLTLSSPNILKVIDLLETYDGQFIEVMEFCPSGDLYELIIEYSKYNTNLHPLEADCFMKQILMGVQFMHAHGIAHCDIKPENILLNPNGQVKIADFGTSCVFQTGWESEVHFQSGLIGTEPFAAPEEYIHGYRYDPRLADCWSCAVVYIAMILGKYLWKTADTHQDTSFQKYINEIKMTNKFTAFENLLHIDPHVNKMRKSCLYGMFDWNPIERMTVEEVLKSGWMTQTECCVDKID